MTPDLVLLNARIFTADAARPEAPALAAARGRILALGATDDIRALAGPRTRVIDAGGRRVLPGLQDAHIHLLDGGTDLVTAAPLFEVTTLAGLQAALAAHAARHAGPVILGTGWQPGLFGDHNLTRAVLDAAVPDRPAIVYDSSFHNACLNSAACRAAGIVRGMDDPPNGHVVRDATGEPTGMLHEDAAIWAQARLPATGPETRLVGLRAGQAHANRHGITGVIDPKIIDYHDSAYRALTAEDGLTLRVSGAADVRPGEDAASVIGRLEAMRAQATGDYRVNAAKFFLDGVFENRTAACLQPYAGAEAGNAPLMFPPDEIAALFPALDAARFQIHVHAIGDLATRAALDGFAAARAANGAWPSLHQIAHVQLTHPDDWPRFAALGVMANLQPLWARYDPVVPDVALDLIGPAREHLTYAFRSLIDAGAPFALGSDWPVSTLNPFEIMETAVTRQPLLREGHREPFVPAERITLREAVLGYTAHAAAACWRGETTGRLMPGFSADLAVLDRDILSCPEAEIGATQVLLTLFKGREVWRDPGFDG